LCAVPPSHSLLPVSLTPPLSDPSPSINNACSPHGAAPKAAAAANVALKILNIEPFCAFYVAIISGVFRISEGGGHTVDRKFFCAQNGHF